MLRICIILEAFWQHKFDFKRAFWGQRCCNLKGKKNPNLLSEIILTCVVKHRGHKSPWTSHVPNQNIPTSSHPEHPNPLFHNIYIRSDNLCIKFFELGTLCPSYQLKKELSCAKLTLISSKTIDWFYIMWTYRAMSSLIVQVLKWHWLHCFICRHGLDIMS